jgi:hypothetical protein
MAVLYEQKWRFTKLSGYFRPGHAVWLKCGGTLKLPSPGGGGGGPSFRRALDEDGGPSVANLLALEQCGEANCPWPPPPPVALPGACNTTVAKACDDPEVDCKVCVALHYKEWGAHCPNAEGTTEANVSTAFCGPQPKAKFDIHHCYQSVCPSVGHHPHADDTGTEVEQSEAEYERSHPYGLLDPEHSGKASSTRRRLFGGGGDGGGCPTLETGSTLEGWGYCPGPPGRWSALSVLHRESSFYGMRAGHLAARFGEFWRGQSG